MHCQQFESRLQALLDSRQDIDTDHEVCRHIEVCPDCQVLASAYAAMAGARLPLRTDTVDGLADRVLAELNTPVAQIAKPRMASTPTWTRVAIALAASVLVVVSLVRLREATSPAPPYTSAPNTGSLAGDPASTRQSIPGGEVFYRTGQGLASISLVGMRSSSTQTETQPKSNENQRTPLFDTFRTWWPAGSESSTPAQGETGWINQLDVTLVA
jgi:anti-sigma factor RsiW